MNRTIATVIIIAWLAVAASIILWVPSVLSDRNDFLAEFVNHEFLSFMGVIVTITLASAANLFVELVKLGRRFGRDAFQQSKKDVRDSAYALLIALVAAIAVAISKPWFAGERGQAFANALAISIIGVSLMILIDLTQATFELDEP